MSPPTHAVPSDLRGVQQSAPARIAVRESQYPDSSTRTTGSQSGKVPVCRPASKRRVFPRSAPQRQLDPSRSKLTGGDGSDGSGEAIQRMLDGLAPNAVSPAWTCADQPGSVHAQAIQAQVARCERLSAAPAAEPEPESELEPDLLSPEQAEELEDYARYYGIDPQNEPSLLWIAREGMEASLPDGWNEQLDERGVPYYYETTTRRTQWKHPYDDYFKDLVRRAREALRETARARQFQSDQQQDESVVVAAGSISADRSPRCVAPGATPPAPVTSAAEQQLEQFFSPVLTATPPTMEVGTAGQPITPAPAHGQSFGQSQQQELQRRQQQQQQQPAMSPEARSIVF